MIGGFGKLVSIHEAKQMILNDLKEVDNEIIDTKSALGRVLAEDLISPIDVPHFFKSAMDGFAVIAEDTFGASDQAPKELNVIDTVMAGNVSTRVLTSGQCIEICTGAPIPEGANAVLMVEYTEKTTPDSIVIYSSVAPGANIIKAGADINKQDCILEKGSRLNPRFTGVIASIGLSSVLVKKRPRVAVLSTGNEVINSEEQLSSGKIYDINSRTICDALIEQQCAALELGIVKDHQEELTNAIMQCIDDCDLILISGGSSLGTSDLLVDIIMQLGEVFIHGIAVKPGKPTIIGKIKDTLVIGLPGNPTSALSNFYIFVIPILRKMMGMPDEKIERHVDATLTRKIASTIGRYEFIAVEIIKEANQKYAKPVLRGSNALSTLAKADGFIEIEENLEVLEKGETVKVKFF